MSAIQGLHHVTAITASAQENLRFYARALGLRFVKKTVNFDDPTAYHLYYGDEIGAPGTIMTFFAWERSRPGRIGAGQVTMTQFAVPPGALPFWEARLPEIGGRHVATETLFGQRRGVFTDPDGLLLALVEADDGRTPRVAEDLRPDVAIRGFHGVTLTLHEAASTARVLTEVFGYVEEAAAGGTTRYRLPGSPAGVVDIHVDPGLAPGRDGAGAVHHVAFSVADRPAQMEVRGAMEQAGLRVTPPIDRDYFRAIYSRTPGGVLFEVATAEPGFTVDEPVERLGSELRLPKRHEPHRAEIERALPPLSA